MEDLFDNYRSIQFTFIHIASVTITKLSLSCLGGTLGTRLMGVCANCQLGQEGADGVRTDKK